MGFITSFHHHVGVSKNTGEPPKSSILIGFSITLPKTNIDPTNGWLEYYFPIGEAYFQGLR